MAPENSSYPVSERDLIRMEVKLDLLLEERLPALQKAIVGVEETLQEMHAKIIEADGTLKDHDRRLDRLEAFHQGWLDAESTRKQELAAIANVESKDEFSRYEKYIMRALALAAAVAGGIAALAQMGAPH